MKKQVQILLKEVTKWAERNPDILVIALVGSYARNEARLDSDIDFVLLASEPEDFINNQIGLESLD